MIPRTFGGADIEFDSAYDLDVADGIGEAAALARCFGRRPMPGDADPAVLRMLQRAHDFEDEAICRAIGLGMDPDDTDHDPEIRFLFAQARACDAAAVRLAQGLPE